MAAQRVLKGSFTKPNPLTLWASCSSEEGVGVEGKPDGKTTELGVAAAAECSSRLTSEISEIFAHSSLVIAASDRTRPEMDRQVGRKK